MPQNKTAKPFLKGYFSVEAMEAGFNSFCNSSSGRTFFTSAASMTVFPLRINRRGKCFPLTGKFSTARWV